MKRPLLLCSRLEVASISQLNSFALSWLHLFFAFAPLRFSVFAFISLSFFVVLRAPFVNFVVFFSFEFAVMSSTRIEPWASRLCHGCSACLVDYFRIHSGGDFRDGSIAQRLEQGSHKPLVLGSNPSAPILA